MKVGGKEASVSITLNSLKLIMVEVFKEPRNNESVSLMQQRVKITRVLRMKG